jgi:hypothetical protein
MTIQNAAQAKRDQEHDTRYLNFLNAILAASNKGLLVTKSSIKEQCKTNWYAYDVARDILFFKEMGAGKVFWLPTAAPTRTMAQRLRKEVKAYTTEMTNNNAKEKAKAKAAKKQDTKVTTKEPVTKTVDIPTIIGLPHVSKATISIGDFSVAVAIKNNTLSFLLDDREVVIKIT